MSSFHAIFSLGEMSGALIGGAVVTLGVTRMPHFIGASIVLRAMEEVPREAFVEKGDAAYAYRDSALGIECGQTISQPFVVAYMTEQLGVQKSHRVLEIGTGSGYQAAVLARLARRVYTIERHQALLREADARFAALRINNITSIAGDGMKGWPAQAPFDVIVISGAVPLVPRELLEQLKPKGRLFAIVGTAPVMEAQLITRIGEDGFHTDNLFETQTATLANAPRPGTFVF
jgi:protein-L-isoaspartate(D-aspartate) O-methyltransferase